MADISRDKQLSSSLRELADKGELISPNRQTMPELPPEGLAPDVPSLADLVIADRGEESNRSGRLPPGVIPEGGFEALYADREKDRNR